MRVRGTPAIVLICVVVIATGCGSSGHRRATAREGPIEILRPDSTGLAFTPVTGASRAERQTVDEFLPLLGPERPITAIGFETDVRVQPHRRRLQITPVNESVRVGWLVSLFGDAVQRRLRQLGEDSEWLEDPGGSTASSQPDPNVERLSATAHSTLQRAAAAGFKASARIYPIGGVWITIRLNERELLAPRRTDWLTALHSDEQADPPLGVDVVAPDGTSVFTAGYGVCYGCSSQHAGATPGTPLPASLRGPTRLKITVKVGGGEPRPDQTVTLNCTPDATASQARACDEVVRDRYALFPPLPSDTTCAGGPGFASAAITGLLGGVPINASYGNCTSVGARWIHDLTAAGVLARVG